MRIQTYIRSLDQVPKEYAYLTMRADNAEQAKGLIQNFVEDTLDGAILPRKLSNSYADLLGFCEVVVAGEPAEDTFIIVFPARDAEEHNIRIERLAKYFDARAQLTPVTQHFTVA